MGPSAPLPHRAPEHRQPRRYKYLLPSKRRMEDPSLEKQTTPEKRPIGKNIWDFVSKSYLPKRPTVKPRTTPTSFLVYHFLALTLKVPQKFEESLHPGG